MTDKQTDQAFAWRQQTRAFKVTRPAHYAYYRLEVTATTRRGREIRCRVVAHAIGDGDRQAGVVLVMEELKP